MDMIPISKFKATCCAVLERVRRTRKPVQVTRFGEPIAEVIPPPPAPRPKRRLGDLADKAKILGDIVGPPTNERDWEALSS